MTGRVPLPPRPGSVHQAGWTAVVLALAALPGGFLALLVGLSVPWRELDGLAAVLFDVLVPILGVTLVAGLLFLGGALLLLTGAGRGLLYVAVAVQVAVTLYWLLALAAGMLSGEDGDGLVLAGLLAALPGVGAVWVASRARAASTTAWLAARASAGGVPQAR
ncbi:hypothetical protein ACWKWC_21380 [Geodermatophilus nigrescens]